MRPIILDLFHGEGGAAKGYLDAGWDLVAVDNDPARLVRSPFRVLQADWYAGLRQALGHWGASIRAVHASPPCTGYTRGTAAIPDRLSRYDRLIPVVREVLLDLGLPFVIENVPDARPELVEPVMLCGRMFGLQAVDDDGTLLTLDRHRLFETHGWAPMVPDHQPHGWKSNARQGIQVAGSYGGARRDKAEARHVRKGGYVPPSVEVQRSLLQAPEWMSEKGIQLSIPPAYTRLLGAQLLEAVT